MPISEIKRATPFYEIDKAELKLGIDSLKTSLERNWGRYLIGYSYKTNALPWVISFFKDEGCYAEVVSETEYRLGQVVGVAKSHFIYNGPIKTEKSFLEALADGCIVNIDSQRELSWLRKTTTHNGLIGLRVNFDIEKDCPGQSQCGADGGRFGFCYENGELEKAIRAIEAAGHTLSGLHLHISSKSRSPEIYKAICRKTCEIADRYKLELSYIDIGGGLFWRLAHEAFF